MIMSPRNMQIEFERRLQLMDPNLVIKEKLTSDTIISFINEAIDKFIKLDILVLILKLRDLNRPRKEQTIYAH